ncbi:isopenicillin N synthase family oxygenase [Streptomyces chartreusis]|uniref:Isopenicillin N synthase family oxygenase n=1 Tax=Streptomyces chartreusis TaxID=1969 RepID=A0A7H8T157_STRCX|nr:isopenicillin N synthase family oxygenase [Streptomyces chartreusis]QKZ17161.1 isopenicillin N synthase family oxygenase [Streptomyces chartreusis]
MSDDIPFIDLAAALADDAPEDLLATVRRAAETLGIIQVVNHGVPTEVIADFNDGFGRVFNLPREQKEQLTSPTGHPFRGWRQWPDDFGRLELERFSIAQYDDTDAALAAGLSPEHATLYTHANVWPPQEPGLRAATHRYHDAIVDVARRVLSLYARVLDVPAETFPLGGDVYTNVVVNSYPQWPHEDASDEEKLLLLEHTDGAAITVLHQEGDYAGLQGQHSDGTWIPVPVRPDALQVFTGTLLTNWSEGRLRPGRHRVVAGGSATRRSSAVFINPSLDTVVEPLPAFANPEGSDFEPVSVWKQAHGGVEEYLRVFGRPEQLAAWRENRPFVADVTA